MNPLEFCEYYCGNLTHEQTVMVEHHVNKGTFLGVARSIAGMPFMPAVKGMSAWDVIDKCGYRQLSAIDGRKLFNA